MKNMKKDWEIYRDTGILGAYRPGMGILRKAESGEVDTIFRDSACWNTDEGFIRKREMLIDGKHFHITSVFSDTPAATPTDKLLSLIDTELEKENRSA